jgi:hypothetical protein
MRARLALTKRRAPVSESLFLNRPLKKLLEILRRFFDIVLIKR